MIKNLVFDFGDVFINLDKKATLNQLQKLGIDEISSEMVYIAEQFEIGTLTSKEFISRCTILFPSISENNIKKAWNAILKDFPLYRFDFLKSLAKSKKYRLFLLSNTNEIHISWIQKEWGDHLFNEFKSFFEQFYLSHEIHLRKPSEEIYKFVLNENKLNPEETFFIDDSEENTRTARDLGIKVWNIDPFHEDVIDLFAQKDFIS